MVAEVEKRKTSGGGGGGKSSGKTDALPQKSTQTRPMVTVRSYSSGSDPQRKDLYRVADLEMENTSPPISHSALFSNKLKHIDRAIKKFDILKEEKAPKVRWGAYIAFERCDGATNTVDGPANSPALPKETTSPRTPSTEHKEARTLAQNSTYILSNTLNLKVEGTLRAISSYTTKAWVKKTLWLYRRRKQGQMEVEALKLWVPRSDCQENRWRGRIEVVERRRSVSRGRTRCHSEISSRTFSVKKGTRWRHRFWLWVS